MFVSVCPSDNNFRFEYLRITEIIVCVPYIIGSKRSFTIHADIYRAKLQAWYAVTPCILHNFDRGLRTPVIITLYRQSHVA